MYIVGQDIHDLVGKVQEWFVVCTTSISIEMHLIVRVLAASQLWSLWVPRWVGELFAGSTTPRQSGSGYTI